MRGRWYGVYASGRQGDGTGLRKRSGNIVDTKILELPYLASWISAAKQGYLCLFTGHLTPLLS